MTSMKKDEELKKEIQRSAERNKLKLKIVEKEKDLKRKINKAEWSKGQRSRLKETITQLRFVLNICLFSKI